jgi:hypothetical protein
MGCSRSVPTVRFGLIFSFVTIAACQEAPPGLVAGNNAAVTAEVAAADGPFGIALAGPVAALRGFQAGDRPGLYRTNAPPRRHPEFAEVIVTAWPDTGVCRIRGVSHAIRNDGDGSRARDTVDRLAGALEERYGPSETFDTCSASSVACEPEFWMMTLHDGERSYGRAWDRPSEAMRRNGISSIELGVIGVGISESVVAVEYQSSNAGGCAAAERRALGAAL